MKHLFILPDQFTKFVFLVFNKWFNLREINQLKWNAKDSMFSRTRANSACATQHYKNPSILYKWIRMPVQEVDSESCRSVYCQSVQ